ncbi:hypothetical protein I9018_00875 [Pseudomonas sp. MPFS]|uniref:hypothetical protein n=1 Tax=Pseudomonas sp. MPFS TaxID=2795724 RepID=UPI001F14260E|nr:hypothetical protein [Pseudomonas sp. MPFS]UMZ12295.1 hypothetical protein I9018_00875 [Pseudomonas sp. MPFS]
MSIKRYSWWSPEDGVRNYGIAKENVFSLTAGPASIEVETGAIFGISSDPSLNSVVVWIERREDGYCLRDEPLETDNELHELSSVDPIYSNDFWRSIAGCRILKITVLQRLYESVRISQLPCQVGLRFSLDSGDAFVAAHGLYDDSDDFSIIPESLISEEIKKDLREVQI